MPMVFILKADSRMSDVGRIDFPGYRLIEAPSKYVSAFRAIVRTVSGDEGILLDRRG